MAVRRQRRRRGAAGAADQVEDLLRAAGHLAAAREQAGIWRIHEEGKGSVLFTALGLADTYARPGITAAVETGGFTPADLFDRNGTLCIVTRTPTATGSPRTSPPRSPRSCTRPRPAPPDGPAPSEPRLLLALDEAGNVFRYHRLPRLLTTARGNGVQLLLIHHDLARVEHLCGGRQVARTVVSNAKLRMLLPGVADLETLRYCSDLIGQTRTHTHGTTTGTDDRHSRTSSEHADHLAPLHRLQQLPDGHAVLLYHSADGIRLDGLRAAGDQLVRVPRTPLRAGRVLVVRSLRASVGSITRYHFARRAHPQLVRVGPPSTRHRVVRTMWPSGRCR